MVTCAKTMQKAGLGFGTSLTKSLTRCAAAVSKCLQQKPDDQSCIPRAERKCAAQAQILAATGRKSVSEKALRAILKACGSKRPGDPPVVQPDDLLAAAGLGLGAQEEFCIALGAEIPVDAQTMADCVLRHHRCRALQLFDQRMPRGREYLGLGGLVP